MKKKILFVTTVIAFMLFALCACGGSSENDDSNSGESGAAKEEKSADVELVESGYTMTEDNYMKYGFVIENPSEDTAYEFPKVIITAYDENGDVLATEEQVLNKIQPGEKQAFGSVVDCNGQDPDKVEFVAESGEKISPADDAIKSSDLEISGTNERKDEYEDTSITGKIKNNSASDTESVGVTVLFKKDGKIILGTTTYVDNLAAGQEKPFEISEYDVPEHDTYEVTGIDWGF